MQFTLHYVYGAVQPKNVGYYEADYSTVFRSTTLKVSPIYIITLGLNELIHNNKINIV